MFSALKRALNTFKNCVCPYLWSETNLKNKFRVIGSATLNVLGVAINLLIPITLKETVDSLAGEALVLGRFSISSTSMLVIYGCLWTSAQFIDLLKRRNIQPILFEAARQLTLKLTAHCINMSTRFHISNKDFIGTIERIQPSLDALIKNLFINLFPLSLELVASSILIGYYFEPYYGGGLFIVVCAYGTLTVVSSNWILRESQRSEGKSIETAYRLYDTLLCYDSVQNFLGQDVEIHECNEKIKDRDSSIQKFINRSDLIEFLQALLIGTGLTALITTGGIKTKNGDYTFSDFLMINAYLLRFMTPLSMLGSYIRDIRDSLTKLEEVTNVLDTESDITNVPGSQPLQCNHGSIRFEHVTFAYEPNQPVLDNISFEIRAGRRIAIVGPSGGGKSTIGKLLLREYDPAEGQIFIDGQNIRYVTIDSLRRKIAMVPQEEEK